MVQIKTGGELSVTRGCMGHTNHTYVDMYRNSINHFMSWVNAETDEVLHYVR